MSDDQPPSLFDLPLDEPGEPERNEEPDAGPSPDRAGPEARRSSGGPGSGRRKAGRGTSDLPLFPEMDEDSLPPTPVREGASRPQRRSRSEPKADGGSPEPPSASTRVEDRQDAATPTVEGPAVEGPGQEGEEERRRSASPEPAALDRRLLAGLADLAVHFLVVALLALGSWLLGAPLTGPSAAGFALFLAVFSFLYTVIPLAFWGHTPGMRRARLRACNENGGALTFGQTALRWVGGLLTLSAAGLPLLLSLLGGRSLTDRLSGSITSRALPPTGGDVAAHPATAD